MDMVHGNPGVQLTINDIESIQLPPGYFLKPDGIHKEGWPSNIDSQEHPSDIAIFGHIALWCLLKDLLTKKFSVEVIFKDISGEVRLLQFPRSWLGKKPSKLGSSLADAGLMIDSWAYKLLLEYLKAFKVTEADVVTTTTLKHQPALAVIRKLKMLMQDPNAFRPLGLPPIPGQIGFRDAEENFLIETVSFKYLCKPVSPHKVKKLIDNLGYLESGEKGRNAKRVPGQGKGKNKPRFYVILAGFLTDPRF